jgi:cyclophilin family peptidyl-prolyl cis-trans isomerase
MSQERFMNPLKFGSALALGIGLLTGLASGTAAAQDEAKGEQPVVILDTSSGPITIALNPAKAPITVANFLKYVDDGFYDNLIFHRVIPGFMIQGGGMNDKMEEKSKGQYGKIKNESGNGLSNVKGSIAMARTADPNSAQNQFFINLVDNKNLDTYGGGYTVFGEVIDGMDVVEAIGKVQTSTRGPHGDVPVKPIYIKSAKRRPKG